MDRTVGRLVGTLLGVTVLSAVRLVVAVKAQLVCLVTWPRRPAIDVGIGDRRRAQVIAKELSRATARRSAALGFALPTTACVLVDRRVYQDEREISSCLDIQEQPNGVARHVIRLALSCQGQEHDLDEILADLNHQILALCYHLSGDPDRRVVVQPSDSAAPIGEWERLTALKGNASGQAEPARSNGPAPVRPVVS